MVLESFCKLLYYQIALLMTNESTYVQTQCHPKYVFSIYGRKFVARTVVQNLEIKRIEGVILELSSH